MRVKGILDEDFVNYKYPSMYISTSSCDFKCDKECGERWCQNGALAAAPTYGIDDNTIIQRYIGNPITKAIVIGGLEPFDTFDEVAEFIVKLRYQYHCNDMVVIYTGYNKTEISSQLSELEKIGNVIVKFGRYIPNSKPRFDDVLGVKLASSNQYAEVIC